MVKIKKQLISSTSRSYGRNNGRKYITIHETANTDEGTGAQTHANLQSNGFSESWHWQVDDKIAIQSFSHMMQLWHAGDNKGNGNLNSIGIEICVNSDGDFEKAVRNAAELTKKIMKDENISLTNVVQHNHWSGKDCPRYLRNGSKGVNWNDFKNLVKDSNAKVTNSGSSSSSSSSGGSSSSGWTKVTGNWTGQTLGRGEYGDPVRQMQTMLANNNPPFYPNKGAKNNGVDGYYGPDTENQVRRYQGYYGLDVDGLAGKQVYNKAKGNPSGGGSSSGKSISQMATEVIRGNHGSGHAARRKSLGISQSQYEKVRAEVNRRL